MSEGGGQSAADGVAEAPRRIGLFGGSFNPPHLGHLALATTARDQLALHELRWLPAGQPWQKTGQVELAAPEHRLAMTQRLIADEPRMRVDARELLRQGPSYTLDTVRELMREAPGCEWLLIIGQDQYARLHTWHGVAELLGLVTLAVAARDGVAPAASPELAAVPHRAQVLCMPRMDVSATAIRHAIARGEDVSNRVGKAVAGYIAQEGLYRPPTR